ncbi:MAG: hypothetical protein ACRD1V_19080 [Vicinamibacterales bacterium]
MRESGLSAAPSLLMYGGAAFLGGLVWIAVSRTGAELHGRAFHFGLTAACLNAFGFVAFAYVFTRRTRAQLAEDVMVLLIIQVALNAAWSAYQSGTISWRLALGTITAVLTIFLLR